MLWKKLCQQNIPAILTHEPGGTILGAEISKSLKRRRESSVSPEAELFLFAASRAQLITEVVRPALKKGRTVICDRFSYSTVAYQGCGRGLSLNMIELVNDFATQGLKPDLVILLDLLPQEGLARKRELMDRFELEELSFHCRVREGYLKAAAADPDQWLVIDASLPRRRIAEIMWEKVSQLLPDLSS